MQLTPIQGLRTCVHLYASRDVPRARRQTSEWVPQEAPTLAQSNAAQMWITLVREESGPARERGRLRYTARMGTLVRREQQRIASRGAPEHMQPANDPRRSRWQRRRGLHRRWSGNRASPPRAELYGTGGGTISPEVPHALRSGSEGT